MSGPTFTALDYVHLLTAAGNDAAANKLRSAAHISTKFGEPTLDPQEVWSLEWGAFVQRLDLSYDRLRAVIKEAGAEATIDKLAASVGGRGH